MKRIWIILLIAAVLSLGWGLRRGEYTTVKRWAETLCTSCIGLTERESGH